MIDRMHKRDKHQPPALIKARPHAMPPGVTEAALEQHFEALLQEGSGPANDEIAQQHRLPPSPLMPNFEAARTQEGGNARRDSALAAAFATPPLQSAESPPVDAPQNLDAWRTADAQTTLPEAWVGTQSAQGNEHAPAAQDTEGAQAAQGKDPSESWAGQALQAGPASLDPRLGAQRKLQLPMKMQQDNAKAAIQEQAAAQPVRQLPQVPAPAPPGGTASEDRIDGIGTPGTPGAPADIATALAPASPPLVWRSQVDAAAATNAPTDASAIATDEALAQELAQDEPTMDASAPSSPARQLQRRQQSERQEILAGETAAAQTMQAQMLVQSNTPESLPLHLLESL
ncbi:hypothetical protein [Variovorax soli]|uniref:Uncharacterized protein n=1 Tax=Variovorax soli TaxID=376815 RepID=A0ABU1NEP1_9BURK|nr:hypothetical protein [Variovorax soli]MDR6536933.1 hypothetical protein [Variovorax soli]